MTTLLDRPRPPGPGQDEDLPRLLDVPPTGADKVFQGVLRASSLVVLAILIGTVVFLAYYGWPALQKAGPLYAFETTWSPDTQHFGMLPLLVGSLAIALVSVAIALPISLATALMINEYAPARLRSLLTGVIDLLATVPSIVYGFWGLELVSGLQAPPAKWLVDHFAFVPIFRTPTPGFYVKSVFACSLICAVTIIPIITSISREVMAQAPRDACEAALALGGTKWGMISTVIFPFSRNGIVGATMLGIGRGLGETMIVVLVLSPANILTSGIMGPNGLGSVAQEITDNFVASSSIYKSALILAGLTLFVLTLAVNLVARGILQRGEAR